MARSKSGQSCRRQQIRQRQKRHQKNRKAATKILRQGSTKK